MKLKIKVRNISGTILPEIIEKGEWIDLRSAKTIWFKAPQSGVLKKEKINNETVSHRDVTFDFKLIPLGIAMQLPRGFEAVVIPRSGTYNKLGIIQANSMGLIDGSYCGNNDEWKFPAIALRDTEIHFNDRICQFRIQLSQKATLWQKIKWMLSSGIKVIEVNHLDGEDRGGFSSTGVK